MMASNSVRLLASLPALLVIFAPIVIWSCPRFQKFGFRFSDNLVWWLAGFQFAALMSLWGRSFRYLPFLFVYVLVMALVTFVRIRAAEEPHTSSRLTVSDGFIASLIVAAVWIPANIYSEVPRRGDALAYHLPMAAQWVQTNSIFAQDSRVWFYPGGYELMTSVFFMLTGNDSLWFVPDLLGWTLLVVSLHGLLMAMGVTRNASALVVGAIVLNPVIRETLSQGNNDLWVAALAVAATLAFLRAVLHDSRQARAAGLICLAALACAKYSAFPWFLLAGLYIAFRRRESFRRIGALESVAFLVTAMLLLSFPIRNFLVTGNPLFPMGIGGLIPWGDTSHLVSTLRKITPEQLASTALIHHSWATWSIFFRKLAELAKVLPILLGINIIFNLFQWEKPVFKRSNIFVSVAGMLAFGVFVTQPMVVENIHGTLNQISSGSSLRFGLPWIILMSALLFAGIPSRFSVQTAAVLLVYTIVSYNLFQFSVIILLASGILSVLGRYAGPRIVYGGLLVPVVLIAVTGLSGEPRLVQAESIYTYGGRTEIAASLQKTSGSRVIILSTALRAWPLIGPGLKHRVVSVGMSLPAEEFQKQAILHKATIVVVPKGSGEKDDPAIGTLSPQAERLGQLLGPEWSVGYDDGFVIAFTRGML